MTTDTQPGAGGLRADTGVRPDAPAGRRGLHDRHRRGEVHRRHHRAGLPGPGPHGHPAPDPLVARAAPRSGVGRLDPHAAGRLPGGLPPHPRPDCLGRPAGRPAPSVHRPDAGRGRDAGNTLRDLGVKQDQIDAVVGAIDPGQLVDVATSVLSGSLGILTDLFFLLTVLIFMAFDTDSTRRGLASLGKRFPDPVAALANFARGTRGYMVVSAGFGLIVAVIDGVALQIMGVPGAFVWAVLAFVTNFIPNIGFVLGVIPPALIALLDSGPGLMIAVIVVYSVINFLIQSVIQPRVVGDTVGLSPILTFLSLVFWTWVIGPLGALLAVPLTLLTRALLVEADPGARWALPLIAGKADPTEPPVPPRRRPLTRQRAGGCVSCARGRTRERRADRASHDLLPAVRPGRGRGSRRRSPIRRGGRSGSTPGLPPCSPQTPTFRPGRVLRPSRVAMSTSRPTPSMSRLSNGETVKTPLSRYAAKNAASTSSLEKPHVVWVRSLVPKEKNSAASATRYAVSAARGSSIMVPIGMSSSTPSLSRTSARIASASSRTRCSSMTEPTRGTMISGRGSPPAFTRCAAAWATARTCRANRPGTVSPRRTPRNPSIGLDSCSRSTAASSRTSSGFSAAAFLCNSNFDHQLGAIRKELVERRIQQADRRGQTVHRGEQLDEVLRLRVGSSSASAASRSSSLSARTTRSMSGDAHPGTCAQFGTIRSPRRPSAARGLRPRRCPRWPAPAVAVLRRHG